MGDRHSRSGRLNLALAIACSLLLFVPLAGDVLTGPKGMELPVPFRSGDDYRKVLKGRHKRLVSIFIGLAARDIARGQVAQMIVPPNLDDIADREADQFMAEARSAFNPDFLRQSSGAELVQRRYEGELTDSQLARLRQTHEEKVYPRGVTAFVGAQEEKRVILYTDAGRQTVYVVPFSASPEGDR